MEQPVKKTIPAHAAVALKHQGSYDQIGDVYRELFDWAGAKGVKPAGRPYTVFLRPPTEEDWNSSQFMVCLPVDASVQGDEKVEKLDVPEQTVVAAEVKGAYDQIPAHYAELVAWIDYEGLEVDGKPREVYIKHPGDGETTDPEDYLTEVQFPVAE
ncbi:MAG: GyrI-like domain-containing protein [Planctomycetota bacterium]